MKINWERKLIWNIKLGQLMAVILAYVFFCLIYTFTISINEISYSKESFIAILPRYFKNQVVNYTIKFILTMPIWFLYFRVIQQWKITSKIALHILTMIAFVVIWQRLFYFITEKLGFGHLRGTSQVWDIYIPALIYIIQFGIFHAFEYYSEVQKQKEIEAQLRQVSLQSELSAIKAQLNPHFLYNVFNTISASVPPEMEQTREMIASLADMFRYQLRASQADFVPLKDEINFVKEYLNLEKLRFGQRLQVKIEVDKALLEEKIPPMILQPLVENAIKHGISSLIEGGEVSIKILKVNNKLHFEIADTGVGLKPNETVLGKGIGLTNTQIRLEKIYNSSLQFIDNQPKGLKIVFEI